MSGIAGTLAVMAAASLCAAAAGCSSSDEASSNLSGSKGKSIEVTRDTWHDGEWPFTVSHGILGCTKPPFPGEVTFNVEGTTYGLNGTALDNGYKEVNPIWHSVGEGIKVDIGGMIDRGLKLCQESK
jgi:hypothetical protein